MDYFNHERLDKLVDKKFKTNKDFLVVLNDNGIDKKEDAIKKWRQGNSTPKTNELPAIAKSLGCSIIDLYDDYEKKHEDIVRSELKNNPQKYTLKEKNLDHVNATYYEDIYACMGSNEIINDETNSSVMTFDRKFLEKELGKHNFKNLSVVKTIGDSMEPTIEEGELLIISPFTNDHNNILSGSVYLISIDNKPYVKRLSEHPLTGNIEVYSDNERHPAFNITKEDLNKLNIIGRVLGHFSFL